MTEEEQGIRDAIVLAAHDWQVAQAEIFKQVKLLNKLLTTAT